MLSAVDRWLLHWELDMSSGADSDKTFELLNELIADLKRQNTELMVENERLKLEAKDVTERLFGISTAIYNVDQDIHKLVADIRGAPCL